MRIVGRARRLVVVAAAAAAVAIGISGGLLMTVGHAAQDDSQAASYGIYNGHAAAAADREQVGSSTNAGFTTGLVDNYYPFARVNVAVAGTSAASSPADTGPFAQAVFGGQNVQQPQYVFAQSPGNPNPPGYSAGSATATASAGPASAAAAATYGSVGNASNSPPGTPADGSDGGTASVTSYFDSALGFVTLADSRVQRASYGAGVLVISNVHVAVKVSNRGDGKYTKDISVTVGGAAVTVTVSLPAPISQTFSESIPVTIDDKGISVPQNNLPIPYQTANDAVNAVLKNAGITAHTVAPQVTQDGANLHVDAEGVVVDVQQVVQPSGVPTQFARHTLGEVQMDNEATSAPPQVDLSSSGSSTDSGSAPADTNPSTSTTTTGGGEGSSSSTITAPTAAPTASPAKPLGTVPVATVITTPQPRWLLLAYLAWQSLMLALAGALYLRRSAQRRLS